MTKVKLPLRFPLTTGHNLAILILGVAGMLGLFIDGWNEGGMPVWHSLLAMFLAAIAAAALTLIYQERRSSSLVRDLRGAIKRIKPSYTMPEMGVAPATATEGLENEIRTLTEQWTAFCHHCQSAHDSEMVQAEHLATVGELAAGLAHEIRNPLAGIAGSIEIISEDFPQEHPDRVILDDLHLEVRRIETTLNELLAYARPKPPQFGPADVKETMARAVQIARQQTGDRIVDFSIHISPDLPAFQADSQQLLQVLLNLVLNSVQAIEREGKIMLGAGLRDGFSPGHPSQVEITVSDTGQGIPPEELDRVFRPFFTTKRGGTGLGLSLSRRIIDGHGGTLLAESELNKGSRFTIRIPLRTAREELTQISLQ